MMKNQLFITSILMLIICNCCYSKALHNKLPIFVLKTYDSIQDNLINITQLQHQITYVNKTFIVKSIWTISFDSLFPVPNELIVLSNEQDIILTSALLNQNKIDPQILDGYKSHYLLQFPDIMNPHKDNELVLVYRSNEWSDSRLRLFNANNLFHIARLVKDASGMPGWDLREREDIDYSETITTSTSIKVPSHYLVFASNYILEKPINVGMYTIGFADSSYFSKSQIKINNTNFQIYYSHKTGLLKPDIIHDLLLKSWPLFIKQFPCETDNVVLFENPNEIFGAGPKGSNILGFNIQDNIPANVQKIISDMMNVPECSSTKEIVEHLYKSSDDPWNDYLTSLLVHELGHLFFGFGKTVERHPYFHDYWFSLSLGMLYDREITKKIAGKYPTLLDETAQYWKEHLSHKPNIDQRLIQPDLTNDSKEGITEFHRSQYFAHGKGFYVLSKIRENIGTEIFDREVVDYLNQGDVNKNGYLDFRKQLLKHNNNLEILEKQLQIY